MLTYEKIIDGQAASHHYFNVALKSGIIQVPDLLKYTFEKLLRIQGTTKSVGNGEAALFWLFSKKYGGLHEVERQTGKGRADLKIGDYEVEVKSWNFDILGGACVKIGRFEKSHDIRKIINTVFGVYNVFYAGRYADDKHGNKSYLSESSFGINGLRRAFECAMKHAHTKNVAKCLRSPLLKGANTPLEYAAKTFGILGKEKLLKKVGKKNFIVNVRPDIIGRIEAIQLGDLDVEVDYDLIAKYGARVQCSELFLNLLAFQNPVDKDI